MLYFYIAALIVFFIAISIRIIKAIKVKIRRKQIKLIYSDKTQSHIEECWNEIDK